MSKFSLGTWLNERDSVREEWLLLLFLFGVAVVAFTLAESYPRNGALLPQLASGVIMLGVIALLAKSVILSYYGEALKSRSLIPDEDDEPSDDTQSDDDEFEIGDSGESRIEGLSKAAMIPRTAFMVAYPVLGFLIGLLWATPIFVFAYMYWTGQRKRTIATFTVLTFVIGYAFLFLLNLRIDSGLLFGGL